MRGVRPFSLLAAPPERPLPPGEGFPRLEAGRLHEAIPAAHAETAALAFLIGASAPSGLLLWVREDAAGAEYGEAYAPGLAQFGVDPGRLLLVRAGKRLEALWAAEEGLKWGGRVLLELGARGKPLDLTATRRLSLAAAATGATALALRGDAGRQAPPSSAWTRWRISSAPSRAPQRDEIGAPALAASLVRHRGGVRAQDYVLEWTGHGYRAVETMGVDLAPAAIDGPDRSARDRRAVA